ncbi:MAG: murein biosynthesis integral membrane protein MurJ [Firmicutes bacterium]|nr:murein biosynthesis integral membrane protein MurJ [Bacillota bacterium]
MSKTDQSFIIRTAGFLMVVNVLSRVLGYVRDVVMMNIFGQSMVTDAYNAAFSIPDTLYQILIGGAMSSAFIPVFASYLANKKEEQAWRVSSVFTSWILLLMVIGIGISFVFTRPLMSLLTDFDTAQGMALTVTLTRMMLIQALLMAMSAIAMAILHANQHFFWPAIGSFLYNVIIVVFGAALAGPIESRWPGYGIAGFSLGVLVGAALFFLVQVPALKKVGFRFSFSLDTHNPGLHRMVALMIPALIGLSVSQINLLVTQKLATGLTDGVYTALRMANRFMQLPIGVFAVAIAVSFFPTLTRLAAVKEMGEYKRSLSLAIRSVAFILLPSAVGLAVLREPIIRLLFEYSQSFSAANTTLTGQALLFYCIGLVGYGIVQVILRGFYAIQNTVTPVMISVSCIALNILFSILLIGHWQHIGLAFANSLAGLIQAALLFLFLRLKIGPMDMRRICLSFLKTGAACVLMGLAAWQTSRLLEGLMGTAGKMQQALSLGGSIAVAMAVFFVAASLMKMEECALVLNLLKGKLKRKKLS